MVYEDRIFIGWTSRHDSQYFLTTVGSGSDFQRQLAEMVTELGPPDIVEFRAANEGFIEGGDYRARLCHRYHPTSTRARGRGR